MLILCSLAKLTLSENVPYLKHISLSLSLSLSLSQHQAWKKEGEYTNNLDKDSLHTLFKVFFVSCNRNNFKTS